MSQKTHKETCSPEEIAGLVQTISGDASAGLKRVQALVADHPFDARLHFMQGSLLAGAQRYDEARIAMSQAVELAPDYAVARYQLGFLQFTSGDTVAAAVTWAPLQQLGVNAPLALFAQGLQLLTQDRFDEALPLLIDGVRLNTDIIPINNDINLIIQGVRDLQAANATKEPSDEGGTSAAQMLLQKYGEKDTKH